MMRYGIMFLGAVLLAGCQSNRELLEQNAATISMLRNQVIDLRAENAGLKTQLERAQQGRIPTGVVAVSDGNRVAEGEVISSNGGEGYEYALRLYQAGDTESAIDAFKKYLQSGASDESIALSQYWIGNAYYIQRDYARAVDYFAAFLKRNPEGDKSKSALNRLIQALKNEGREAEAKAVEAYGVNAIQ